MNYYQPDRQPNILPIIGGAVSFSATTLGCLHDGLGVLSTVSTL